MTRRAGPATRPAPGPAVTAGRAAGRALARPPARLAPSGRTLEKYPVVPNYPAEHLFTTNTYML